MGGPAARDDAGIPAGSNLMLVVRANRRRVRWVSLALIVVAMVFMYRLVDFQVVRASALSAEADDRRSVERTLYGSRGEIVDRDDVVLADAVMRYDLALSPKSAGPTFRDQPDPEDPDATISVEIPLQQVLTELGMAVGMTPEQLQEIIDAALAADPDSDFAYFAKNVDQATTDQVRALGIPWVQPWEHPGRRYPNGAVAGNLLGFMGDDGALAGLELEWDQCLTAEDGAVSFMHSAKDWVEIPNTRRILDKPTDGGTLKLTIDADLQWFTQSVAEAQVEAVDADWATVTVMEAKTGKLIAVADVPTVDPNNPTGVAAENRGTRAFTAPYEPGSTMKALTAASLIDAGVASPTTQVVAPYRYNAPNDADVNDSSWHEDLDLTLTGVLIESSNTGLSQLGELMTDTARYNDFLEFGLGTASEVNFPGEADGDLHGVPEEWDNQTKYTTMFGQGLTTTAIQVASVYQTIANGGVRMPVSLVEGCELPNGKTIGTPAGQSRQVISPAAASQTSQMLERVYTEAWLKDKWNIPGYRVATKTGTAQFPDGKGGYLKEYLVSVSGFAPADNPEYVVSVSVFNARDNNTSAAAAPIFQQVMSQVLKDNRVVPSGAPAPEIPARW
ncbi:peptidoglycan D,D-transpeptidase FtsI family protein [Agromyces humi]|uniref:peptidoglycan D,D-transpeptidase FtsI family protein n=1 Tax=Agromyces humi TaxID=1766800 RepID=UPI0013596335|nr:penicillin-binding protein 2 [Agromyces humi]